MRLGVAILLVFGVILAHNNEALLGVKLENGALTSISILSSLFLACFILYRLTGGGSDKHSIEQETT